MLLPTLKYSGGRRRSELVVPRLPLLGGVGRWWFGALGSAHEAARFEAIAVLECIGLGGMDGYVLELMQSTAVIEMYVCGDCLVGLFLLSSTFVFIVSSSSDDFVTEQKLWQIPQSDAGIDN